MSFAGLNYVAILVAAIGAWIFGAIYYTALSKPWIAAHGKTIAQFKREQAEKAGQTASWLPFVLSFVAEIIMAWVLAGVLGHLGPGQVTVRNGVVSAAFLWFGLVLTTIVVNNAFAGRKPMLSVIDAGHWLGALILMGIVVGAFGVR